MTKVSIILPVYNVEKYISKSIQSVLNQTYRNFELLVVIDGSPDNSKKIAETFTDKRIKILEKENGGLSDARNFGLDRANGEYIYFLDSDDWIEPNLLEDNLKIIEEKNLDFIVFGYIQDNVNAEEKIYSTVNISPKVDNYKTEENDLTLDAHHLGILGYAWNKIYKKTFLDQNNFKFQKGISLVEDILFNAPLYQKSTQIYFNKKCYYHYINRDIPTLMKQFHLNSFELIKKKINAISLFMYQWQFKNTDSMLAFSLVHGIRYCIHNLFSYKNQLNISQKIDFVKKMINDKLTQEFIDKYPTKSKADKLYKFCIKYKLTLPIVIFALIKKS